MEIEPFEFIQSSFLGQQSVWKLTDLSSPTNTFKGAIGLFVVYGSWNRTTKDNAGIVRLLHSLLSPHRREDVKYATGSVQAGSCDEELDACCGDNNDGPNAPDHALPCPPEHLPAILLILKRSSMKQPEVRYLTSLSSNDILKYWKDSSASISDSISTEFTQILRSFGMAYSIPPPMTGSGEAIRVFVAGDRMSVGKTSVCLGLLSSLVAKGYPCESLAYIKPATQNEKPQLVQRYCERLGIPCVPIGPVVYYRGFTRAFLAGETESSRELLQKVEDAVDTLAKGKRVVIVDGVGFPAVGSICGTDNASVARASGYPNGRKRRPPGVIIVGGSGVGGAVDAFNLNATYFEMARVPVLGAIFNKLSEEGFYSLENVRKQISLYFGQNGHQIRHGRQAFGFVPLFAGIAGGAKDAMKGVEEFGRIFEKHVDVNAIMDAAARAQEQSFPQPMEMSSDEEKHIVPTSNKKQKLSSGARSRAEIEAAAIRAGAAPSA